MFSDLAAIPQGLSEVGDKVGDVADKCVTSPRDSQRQVGNKSFRVALICELATNALSVMERASFLPDVCPDIQKYVHISSLHSGHTAVKFAKMTRYGKCNIMMSRTLQTTAGRGMRANFPCVFIMQPQTWSCYKFAMITHHEDGNLGGWAD